MALYGPFCYSAAGKIESPLSRLATSTGCGVETVEIANRYWPGRRRVSWRHRRRAAPPRRVSPCAESPPRGLSSAGAWGSDCADPNVPQWLFPSSNGEGVFKPLIDSVLGPTSFPFDWESYTEYNLLPPLPKLKERKTVSLTPGQLSRLAGRYALAKDVVLSVSVENGRLFVQENDEPKQELLPESAQDFYSASSSDECTFKPDGNGPAQVLILHLGGKDFELKRVR
jgi:hypothetical protein